MNNLFYILLLFFSVFISAVSQIVLKKSAMEQHASFFKEYVNFKVIFAYVCFFSAVCIDLFALKFVSVSFVPIIETSSYIFIILLSRFIFNEKISRNQTISIMLIIAGIVVYVI
ncbi:EamA family transporter [Treponema brennaborense]|uniref:EamA domain-containing protein n=1 Tax=Treponema brennaborense (strain DSM 12168 / CIP 105900 / DD5/3) TaxID=906968 RepID=F4LMI2_TREBD|nr:EamA family transporter [Treponema brennaborense]AEE15744.1 protein of unknown function DUF6 transmembrane [Treponema brennaborense DSM 12168]